MEDFIARSFKGGSKIILYPSSFSRPQHAYGFAEGENNVIVYKIGDSVINVVGTVFHELLHPLIHGWWKAERMKEPISELAEIKLFKASWEKTGNSPYPYPNYWLDELVVHSLSNYMLYEIGFVSKEWVQQFSSCCSYEVALCDALFDLYNTFNSIDDFLYYAIKHIKVYDKDTGSKFVYVDENGQPHLRQKKGTIGIELTNWPAIIVFSQTTPALMF